MDAGCFIGTFQPDGTIGWTFSQTAKIDPALSLRGLYEPAIAELQSGDLLMIARGSNIGIDAPGRKWVALSTDGGASWSTPTPLTDESGTSYFSPSSGSRLLRHSRTGRLYWVRNLCDSNPEGNHPRHPLFVGEIDEARCCLLRSSLQVIDQRGSEDDETLQLSNFRLYEDRETGELVLHLCRLLAKTADALHAPAYEYRIKP